jgi:putative nucleotidyltransferase with HDIG domain
MLLPDKRPRRAPDRKVNASVMSKPLPKILVVDDEPLVREFLARAVSHMSREAVGEANSANEACERMKNQDYDLIISDLTMANGDGMELLGHVRESGLDIGFILISGYASPQHVIAALRQQASDFLIKPVSVAEIRDSVSRTYRNLLAQREARAYHGRLETTVQRRTRDLENALREVETNYDATLEALVASLDAREHETFSHSFRVRAYASYLAREIGYSPTHLRQLEHGALLHDIGKIAIRDSILLKPGRLTPEEWLEMRKHPIVGEAILNHVAFLAPAAIIVRHHHESYDGTGYPDGLIGEEIPLGARVFAFADTMDAMTSDRPYRKAAGFEAIREEILRCSGTQFDPHIADTFLSIPIQHWKELRAEAELRDSATIRLPELALA